MTRMLSSCNPAARYSYLDHHGGQTHYHLTGPADGEVIVLVTGATLPLSVWDPLVEPLLRLGYRVLRFDLAGRGGTTTLDVRPGLDSVMAQHGALLDGLELRRPVHLVGLASGAISVSAFALAQPKRVARIALLAPDGRQTLSLREKVFVAPLIGELLIATVARRIMLKRVRQYSDRAEVQQFLHALMLDALSGPGYQRAVLDYVRAFPLQQGQAYYAGLARAGFAVRVILGAEDHINQLQDMQKLTESLGPGAVEILHDIGHLPHVEASEAVADALHAHFAAAGRHATGAPRVANHGR